MANWEKLNAEFDSALDSMTAEQNYTTGTLHASDNGKQMERIVDSSTDTRFRSAFGLKVTLITAIG